MTKLNKMWEALAAYQPKADAKWHGESCEYKCTQSQIEQCGGKFDVLLHRLCVVSREGNSELDQRLNGIMNGLGELDRRIAMQLDMLEL